jgi:hypothetical protein
MTYSAGGRIAVGLRRVFVRLGGAPMLLSGCQVCPARPDMCFGNTGFRDSDILDGNLVTGCEVGNGTTKFVGARCRLLTPQLGGGFHIVDSQPHRFVGGQHLRPLHSR